MTVVVLVAAAIKLTNAEIHDIRAQALGTLFYCANWVIIFAKGSYFTSIGRPSPFLHMWTLAVEEQFYVVLPLVLFAARRVVLRHPVRAAAIALLGALASTIWMGVLFSPSSDPSRAYLGSDSHAMGLLVGVALGVLAGAGRPWEVVTDRLRAGTTTTRLAPVVAAAALVALLVIMRVADANTTALYRGGFLVFAVLCAVIIAVVVTMPETALARVLGTPALVAIGLRSYSLYLWHWPVRVFVTTSSGLDGFALFAVRLVVSVVLAEISFRCVEQPFRLGGFARRWGSRAAVAYFVVLTLVAAVLVVTVAAPKALPPSDLAHLGGMNGNTDPNALRVDTFGDSTALVFGIAGATRAGARHHGRRRRPVGLRGGAGRPRDRVARHRQPGDLRGLEGALGEGVARRSARAPRAHDRRVGDPRPKDERGLVRFGTTAWTDLVTSSLRTALAVLTSDGRTVYLFEVPCYGAGDVSAPFPERSDPRRIAALNTIYEDVAHSMAHVSIVHWRTLVCPGGHRADTIGGVHMWQADDQHLTDAGGVVVWKWWLPQIR